MDKEMYQKLQEELEGLGQLNAQGCDTPEGDARLEEIYVLMDASPYTIDPDTGQIVYKEACYKAVCPQCGKTTCFQDPREDNVIECMHCDNEIDLGPDHYKNESLVRRLYKLNANGSTQVWELHCDDTSYWTVTGKLDGKMIIGSPTFVKARRGKTLGWQVESVCQSKLKQQKDKGYVEAM